MGRVRSIPKGKYLEIGREKGRVADVAKKYGVALSTVYQARKVAEWEDRYSRLTPWETTE